MKWIKILAMAYKRKELITDLKDDRSREFAHHCAKLCVCNYNDINIPKWKKELYGFCNWIQESVLKPDNKWIGKKFIDEYFFGKHCDTKDTFALALNDAWYELGLSGNRNKENDLQIFNNYRSLCDEVSTNLSKHTLNQVIISSLCDKYITNIYKNLV